MQSPHQGPEPGPDQRHPLQKRLMKTERTEESLQICCKFSYRHILLIRNINRIFVYCRAITEVLETTASSTPIKTSKRQTASQKAVQSATATTTTTTVIQTSSSSSSSATVSNRKSASASTSNGNETPPAKKGNVSAKELKELENKRTKEIKQNEVNERIVKKTITSTPKMSPNTSATFKLNSSHEDLDLDKHPAYKEYIQAGEYWK